MGRREKSRSVGGYPRAAVFLRRMSDGSTAPKMRIQSPTRRPAWRWRRDGALIATGERSVYCVERDGEERMRRSPRCPGFHPISASTTASATASAVSWWVRDGDRAAANREGELFLIAADASASRCSSPGLGCSNGIGFSPCGKYVYHIDTPTKKVRRYHYDP